jgi:acyl dehydratase
MADRTTGTRLSGSSQWFFEDVEIGQPLETPGMTVTEAHVELYASLVGWRPAEGGAVPDLLPLALSSGLGWRANRTPLAVLAFMGFEWSFHQPVRVGDTIHNRSRTAAKRGMKEGGIVLEEREVLNQRGEVVQSGRLRVLVARRPSPAP